MVIFNRKAFFNLALSMHVSTVYHISTSLCVNCSFTGKYSSIPIYSKRKASWLRTFCPVNNVLVLLVK